MAEGAPAPGGSSRAERDEARRRRAEGAPARRSYARGRPSIEDRPPAPWGSFPLSEITVLLAIVLVIGGLIVGGDQGVVMFAAGLALGSLAGLEVSIREHFAGYRSHTTLFAGFAFVLVTGLVWYVGDTILAVALAVGAVAFAITFYLARRAFQRASGGLGFRVGGMRG